jgi:PQQ-dependent dehydrogenase (methanol/ethanol family)
MNFWPVGLGFLLSLAASAQPGSDIFSRHCAVCHGDGRGTERGPNLAHNRKVRGSSRDELRQLIRNGVPAAGMPAFPLPAAELDAVTDFVLSLSAPAAAANPPGDPAAGEAFFHGAGGCAACHMVFGRGKAVGPDLSSIGRELTLDELQQALARPAGAIRPGYQVVTVTRRDGARLRGFARNRNLFSLQLQDFDGRFHLLSQSEITRVDTEPGSLMPARPMADAERRNLLAYLSSLIGASETRRAAPFTDTTGPDFHRIAHPAPADWPSYHGRLSGNRHSELTEITPDNVARLVLKWVFPINHFTLEVTPVVVDGVMYVTGPNQVFALDARAGRTLWHYQRPRSPETRGDPAKGTNRGVALLGDRVFFVTDNARLIALHRVTGQLLWETNLRADLSGDNYGNTAAPLVVNDLVVAGISGGDLGMRGFLSAFRATTGERVWRFFTVPAPGEPGSETWQGSALASFGGGGATWMTGTFDPETNTVFWGVGNPYPALNGDERRGDNLYTSGLVALDAATGKLKWHYQFTPHDLYDWDGGQTPLLVNRPFRGRPRQLLIQANRNGFFYVFDRTSGELLLAEKFVDRLTWAKGIGKDGRPILVDGQQPTRDGTKICPNILGAANWPAVAVNPATGWFYVQAREACGIYVKPPSWNPRPIPLEPGFMVLRALDIETGRRVWELPQLGSADSWGGVLSTASGLIFYGEDSGSLAAVDARSGKPLWHVPTNASAELGDGHSWRSSPMTYSAGGRQYVAVAAGPNILAFGLPE